MHETPSFADLPSFTEHRNLSVCLRLHTPESLKDRRFQRELYSGVTIYNSDITRERALELANYVQRRYLESSLRKDIPTLRRLIIKDCTIGWNTLNGLMARLNGTTDATIILIRVVAQEMPYELLIDRWGLRDLLTYQPDLDIKYTSQLHGYPKVWSK
jgi:hypothetical protein